MSTFAHQPDGHAQQGQVQYLANEGVMAVSGEQKVLFDPFFHQNFGIYQTVPEHIIKAIMNGESPYDGITAVFISHAHGDHFAADSLKKFMLAHSDVVLFAPKQAVKQLSRQGDFDKIASRINSIELAFGDAVTELSSAGLNVDAARIPHSGWPGRADVENIVFRVEFSSGMTVMHMGDADVNVEHYLPYRPHYQKHPTDIAFPPYWFLYSMEGRDILAEYLYTHEQIGVHVPQNVPAFLKDEGHLYFSVPGQWHAVGKH